MSAKRVLAWLPDEPRLFEYLTVSEHLEFAARIHQVVDGRERGDALLEELELDGKRDALPGELSRGMRQKLSIACGFLHRPQVLVFDEPLTGLDPLGIRRMKDSIRRRAVEGAAVVISSHLLHLLEELCTHVVILSRGTSTASGSLEEVRRQFADGDAGANLEDIFLRATQAEERKPPPIS